MRIKWDKNFETPLYSIDKALLQLQPINGIGW